MTEPSEIYLTTILDNLEKIFTILAIIIGGKWAYFNFFKSRIYRIRLEPIISGEVIMHKQKMFLKVKLQLKNAGTSMVKIKQEGSGFRIFSVQDRTFSGNSQIVEKERLKTYRIFQSHKWVESNETIVEEQMIAISGDQHFYYFRHFT